jgi:hypothetical protein
MMNNTSLFKVDANQEMADPTHIQTYNESAQRVMAIFTKFIDALEARRKSVPGQLCANYYPNGTPKYVQIVDATDKPNG